MTNLLIRLGWEARVGRADLRDAAAEVVDYMPFVDEAPLGAGVTPSSNFAQKFSERGPRDGRGRSLRDLDLHRRLLKYPCSYMIYSDVFDALPSEAKDAVYRRMWHVLATRFEKKDRDAVVEILRATKKDLPSYFRGSF